MLKFPGKWENIKVKIHRLYFVLTLSFLLLAGTWLMATPPSYTTADVFNGHMWQLLSSSQKASHLTGIQEGIKLCLNQIREDLQVSADLMREIQDSGLFDRRRLLFANLEIPIIHAYQHVTLELNYASAQELANNMSSLRRKYGGSMD
jgi:hypothetical protein